MNWKQRHGPGGADPDWRTVLVLGESADPASRPCAVKEVVMRLPRVDRRERKSRLVREHVLNILEYLRRRTPARSRSLN